MTASWAEPTLADLLIDDMAVAYERAPRYERGLPEMTGMFGQAGSDSSMLANHLRAVAEHAGVAPDRMRRLAEAPAGGEPVDRVLRAIGAPATPQPVVVVQDAPDRDPFASTLPRLIHEAGWPVTEELTLTHLYVDATCALLDFLSWWADPAVGATVLLSHQPVYVDDDRIPSRLTAVALRFGPAGRLAVREWQTVAAGGGHVCEGWPEVHASLREGRLRRGHRLTVRSGACRVQLEYLGSDLPGSGKGAQ